VAAAGDTVLVDERIWIDIRRLGYKPIRHAGLYTNCQAGFDEEEIKES
jgi:hypothetical protein